MSDFADKIRSLQVMHRAPPRVVEGKAHPDSGRPFKQVMDELGNIVTEHSAPGAAPGVSDRQDVTIRPRSVPVEAGHTDLS